MVTFWYKYLLFDLEQIVNFPVPQFPNMLFDGDNFLKSLLGFSALMQIKSKAKDFAHSNCPVNGN